MPLGQGSLPSPHLDGPDQCTRSRRAIRLIEDILVVSKQVCRASFPVGPHCDFEAPGIFVARLGDEKDRYISVSC